MSKRGIIPMVIATGIGVINGIWVFRPAFKEHQSQVINLRKDPAYDDIKNENSSLRIKKDEISISEPKKSISPQSTTASNLQDNHQSPRKD